MLILKIENDSFQLRKKPFTPISYFHCWEIENSEHTQVIGAALWRTNLHSTDQRNVQLP